MLVGLIEKAYYQLEVADNTLFILGLKIRMFIHTNGIKTFKF